MVKGFTLIELILAIAIIGLLAAVGVQEARDYNRKNYYLTEKCDPAVKNCEGTK